MLKEKYKNIILGQNYISLIKGIVALSKGETTLNIDYKGYSNSTNWLKNLSELDKKVLQNVGRQYGIESLEKIDDFLKKDHTLIYFNEKSLEFCHSPYLNLKEIMRKFPHDFGRFFEKFYEEVSEEDFNQEFNQMLDQLALLKTLEQREKFFKANEFDLVSGVLSEFLNFLNAASNFSQQLNHIFQVMLQTSLTPQIKEIEKIYLFIAAISPRYLLDDGKLIPELLFTFRKMGGDLKKTLVSDWGIIENKIKYITLGTIDGAIHLENVMSFIPQTESLPFYSKLKGENYMSINFKCNIDHKYCHFYQDKRVLISASERMGSDFPYWEFRFYDNELRGVYSYLDSLGSKPSFFYHHIVEDVYQVLQGIIPGILKADWVTRVKLSQGQDSWFAPGQPSEMFQTVKRKQVYQSKTKQPLKGIDQFHSHYAGPMGLYAYVLDVAQ